MHQATTPQTRMTVQRSVILEELRKLRTHPTADEIYHVVRQRLPRISLGTVYRNLEHLTHTRDILKLNLGGNVTRFDGCCEERYHAACLACGRIFDIPAEALPKISPTLSEPGFQVTDVRISFEGYCAACQS